MKITTLSIVIPAYNEAATIHMILNKIKKVELVDNIQKEIIIVNDCSKDNTREAVLRYMKHNPSMNIVFHEHEVNKGKGAALHTGISKASGEYLIIQDADLEYDPEDYGDLLEPFLRADADVVYGSRFIGSKPHRVLLVWHFLGNKFLTFLSNALSNLNLSDMEVGLKAFRTSILQQLSLRENGFGFEPEITAKISKVPGIKIYEVGIAYYGRTYEEGKKITWRDGVKALYCILRYNLFSKRHRS